MADAGQSKRPAQTAGQSSGPAQAVGSQSSRGSGGGPSARSYKEMVEAAKRLHKQADTLQERICRLHCQFADTALKAAFLFDPATVQILTDANDKIGGLPSPTDVHFARQTVNDAYIELSQAFPTPRPHVDEPEL